MKLLLNRLRIRIHADHAEFGADLSFSSGLNVIRADNTSGKSTCFQAIVYALGLDAMLTSKQFKLPLTPVLDTEVLDDVTGEKYRVTSSEIWLEIENELRQKITLHRVVFGSSDNRLITVYESPLVDDFGMVRRRDMYVRLPGAAYAENGLHRWLAEEFLQWSLPKVDRTDGSETTLYLETLFPLFFVEQRFGWTRIQGNLPYVFGIRDVARRATEFVLGLSVTSHEILRARLQLEKRNVNDEYSASVRALGERLRVSGAVAEELPFAIPRKVLAPKILVERSGQWFPVDRYEGQLELRLQKVEADSRQVRKSRSLEFGESLERRADVLSRIERARSDLRIASQERLSLVRRRSDLIEQSLKLEDLRSLAKVGGAAPQRSSVDRCPTCWQTLADSVDPDEDNVMSLEETLSYVKSEIMLINETVSLSDQRLSAKRISLTRQEEVLSSMDIVLDSMRSGVDGSRGASAIADVLETRRELKDLTKLKTDVSPTVRRLNELIEAANVIDGRLKEVSDKLSPRDKLKIAAVESSFREQQRQYGFRSFDVNDLTISEETFRPAVGGLELSFETSASDAIRTIWSFLISILELARTETTMNHPGLVVFDEPRQQSAAPFSFAQLLRRAAVSKPFAQQVIFFTSDALLGIEDALRGVVFELRSFQGSIIKKLA